MQRKKNTPRKRYFSSFRDGEETCRARSRPRVGRRTGRETPSQRARPRAHRRDRRQTVGAVVPYRQKRGQRRTTMFPGRKWPATRPVARRQSRACIGHTCLSVSRAHGPETCPRTRCTATRACSGATARPVATTSCVRTGGQKEISGKNLDALSCIYSLCYFKILKSIDLRLFYICI